MNLKVKFLFSIGLLGLLCIMLPGSVRADTYTYTSNPYTLCGGTYCTGGPYSETITFTTTLTGSALDSLDMTTSTGDITVDITSFSFTDTTGSTITQTNESDPGFGDGFFISTDSNGNIMQWLVYADIVTNTLTTATEQEGYTYNQGSVENAEDYSSNYTSDSTGIIAGGRGYNLATPSNWTDITTATNTPEPSSMILLSTGLLALMAMGWRRNSQAGGSVIS